MNRREGGEFAIADLQLPIEGREPIALSNRKLQIGNRKFINYVVARGWMHLVLLTGVGIFIFPFVWMLGTSIKTDDEVTSEKWLPAVPTFVARSPYALPAPDLIKPL